MTKTEIIENLIETITEAGYDYHDYGLTETAGRIIRSHQDGIEMGEAAEETPASLPDDGTVWEWLNEAAHREGAPDLLHLAA
jgi:hypothetical protein